MYAFLHMRIICTQLYIQGVSVKLAPNLDKPGIKMRLLMTRSYHEVSLEPKGSHGDFDISRAQNGQY